MSNKIKPEFYRGSRGRIVSPAHKVVAKDEEDKDSARAKYIPRFKTAKEFAAIKIKMLREEFCVNLSPQDEAYFYTLKTEAEINSAFKKMLNKYWR